MVHQLTETDCKTPIKLSNDGIVVSQRFAQNNKLKKGDIVTIESIDGIKADVKVANICEMYFQHFAFLSTSMYESLFEEKTVETMLAVKTSKPSYRIVTGSKTSNPSMSSRKPSISSTR